MELDKEMRDQLDDMSRWETIDPVDRACRECGTEAVTLLTIASREWDGGTATWTAKEDRPTPGPPPLGARDGNFTQPVAPCLPALPLPPHCELLQ